MMPSKFKMISLRFAVYRTKRNRSDDLSVGLAEHHKQAISAIFAEFPAIVLWEECKNDQITLQTEKGKIYIHPDFGSGGFIVSGKSLLTVDRLSDFLRAYTGAVFN